MNDWLPADHPSLPVTGYVVAWSEPAQRSTVITASWLRKRPGVYTKWYPLPSGKLSRPRAQDEYDRLYKYVIELQRERDQLKAQLEYLLREKQAREVRDAPLHDTVRFDDPARY